MIKNIILIPGLNGKFDSFSFNVIINWALKHNIPLSKLTFSKYKTSEKFSSTFKEQIKELEDQIKDDGKDFLIVAKSLGCIPALLCQSKANKLLVSPPVIITQTNEKLLEMKFSDMLTNPIEIGEEKFKNSAIIFSKNDKRILPDEIKKLKNCDLYPIECSDHDPSGEEVEKDIKQYLDKYA